MGKVIAIANSKGGVGKTTTVANLGAALSRLGKKVCFIDYDPQCSLTNFFDIDLSPSTNNELPLTVLDLVLTDRIDPKLAIVSIDDNLDIIPCHKALNNYESAFQQDIKRARLFLKRSIDKLKNDYDYILIDSPGAVNTFLEQTVAAANDVLIPIKASDMDVKATAEFLNDLDQFKDRGQIGAVSGILFTMIKSNSKTHEKYIKTIFSDDALEDKVLNATIRDNAFLATSSASGNHIFGYRPKSIGAEDYLKVAEEVLKWQ